MSSLPCLLTDTVSTNQTIIPLKIYNNGSYLCASHLTYTIFNPHIYPALLPQINIEDNENH